MTDVPPGGSNAQAVPPSTARTPFPAVRLVYALGYGIVAWFVFWAVIVLGVLQFVVFAFDGKANDELKEFSARLVQYLWELAAFITFARDERPFPVGLFPHGNEPIH